MVPNPRLIKEVFGDQGSHGANVDDIPRKGVLKRILRQNIDDRMIAPLDDGELSGPGNLVTKADATSADDAPVAPNVNLISHFFRVLELLGLHHAGAVFTVLEGVVLKHALTRFVANGTVEGMVDEHELQDPGPRFLHILRGGEDFHTLRHRGGAGSDGLL